MLKPFRRRGPHPAPWVKAIFVSPGPSRADHQGVFTERLADFRLVLLTPAKIWLARTLLEGGAPLPDLGVL